MKTVKNLVKIGTNIITGCPDEFDPRKITKLITEKYGYAVDAYEKFDYSVSGEDIKRLNNNYFTRVFVTDFNTRHNRLAASAFLEFNFINKTVIVNGVLFKVKDSRKYLIKVYRTEISAIGGIQGLYDYALSMLDVDSEDQLSKILNRISKYHR